MVVLGVVGVACVWVEVVTGEGGRLVKGFLSLPSNSW